MVMTQFNKSRMRRRGDIDEGSLTVPRGCSGCLPARLFDQAPRDPSRVPDM